MDDLISVVIPVFKVEDYLDKCVSSIVNQTYRNLEIILVDDGSPDGCPEKCDERARLDSRIVVIHKKNGGLSDARNYGTATATGECIGFVDSDDWIDLDFYETLHSVMSINQAQIAASDVVWVYDDHKERKRRYEQTVFTPEQALETIMRGDGFHATAWNKLYGADLIRCFSYPVGRLHEDEFVTYRVIAEADQLVLCQNTTYYYRQRKGSIMANCRTENLDAVDAFLERLKFLHNRFPELYQRDKPFYCVMLTGIYRDSLKSGSKLEKEVQKQLIHYRNKIHYSIPEMKKYTASQILYIMGTAINLDGFSRLLNWRAKNE